MISFSTTFNNADYRSKLREYEIYIIWTKKNVTVQTQKP